ncbi:putative fatty-acyl-CoA-transporting ATPase [Medicago truncatula]|uniref:ABC transporter D family protein n=1 Tax=Medicago truncatula TaxID=3880 RepID=G7IT31_MEDTR|nr:ABC transporter D family member 2, chloroplastic [Medicago truncatula]AES66124.2 ABC transporter D family protein [Medicago truncatula]RHN74353.1 putative fatty-acyl-CoA-transporting ATPase [Medicago truncatula]
MILLTQQIAQPLFIISYKSNPSFNNHVQLHQGFTLHTPFSQLPIMPLSNGRPFRRKNFNKCVSESGQSPLPTDPDKKDEIVGETSDGVVEVQGENPDLQTLFRRFWKVAAPYWSSDDKVQARLQLAGVFALTLATTGISVGFSFLGRDFYNALANKDQEQFTKQLLYYLGGFAGGIPFFVLRDYARETLSLRWRSWMTRYYMDRYLKDQTFYKIQSQSIIDNPDQRIVDDLSSFTGTALSFSLALFNAAIDLISFSNILYGIYPPLFVVLLIYSIGGTAISVFLGKGLVTLNFLQEKKEADFRYGLVRVRENAESIAFYGGEESEMQLLLQRFKSAFENLTQLLISSRNLEFFTNGYRYVIQVLPAAVVAPMYFSGKIEFGVINQSVSAFNHILGDFSLIVYQFQAISAFSAVINRLGEFDDILDRSNSKSLSDSLEDIDIMYKDIISSSALESNGLTPQEKHETLLEIDNLILKTPSDSTLITDLSLTIKAKDNLLITGPSGSGKTSLLRVMAGLWRTGTGKIIYYVKGGEDAEKSISSDVNTPRDVSEDRGKSISRKSGIFFLPQKPYMVLGTLRQQLLYPTWGDDVVPTLDSDKQKNVLPFLSNSDDMNSELMKPKTDELIKILEDVRLGYILPRFGLDSTHEWSSVLSLGEQQRLAFARLLLSKPQLALLDESTSALDEANEVYLYEKIAAAGITYISVGHRSTLSNFHDRILRISTTDSNNEQPNWHIEPTRRESSLKV